MRRMCDLRWKSRLDTNPAGHQSYEDYLRQCARSCPPPAYLTEASASKGSVVGAAIGLLAEAGVAVGLSVGDHGGPSDQPTSP